jgi:hypothetical protein
MDQNLINCKQILNWMGSSFLARATEAARKQKGPLPYGKALDIRRVRPYRRRAGSTLTLRPLIVASCSPRIT